MTSKCGENVSDQVACGSLATLITMIRKTLLNPILHMCVGGEGALSAHANFYKNKENPFASNKF